MSRYEDRARIGHNGGPPLDEEERPRRFKTLQEWRDYDYVQRVRENSLRPRANHPGNAAPPPSTRSGAPPVADLEWVAGGSGTFDAAVNSMTIPGTEQTGDFIAIGTGRFSGTPATLPGTYTNIANAGTTSGADRAIRAGYRVATSGSESSGTWTNATTIAGVLFRNVHATTPLGNVGAAVTTSTFPACALTSGHNNKNFIVLIMIGGNTGTNGDTEAPETVFGSVTGFTIRAYHDNGDGMSTCIWVSTTARTANFSATAVSGGTWESNACCSFEVRALGT